MRDYRGKSCPLRHLYRRHRLGQGANLVELNQDRVGSMLLNAPFQAGRIGDEQIITHKLYAITEALAQQFPAIPVILAQTIFDSDDGVFRDPLLVEVYHFTGGECTTLPRQYI